MVKLLRSLFFLASLSFAQASYAETETVWIDVRSAVEHKLDHIDGDIRVSHIDIVEKVSELFPDKTTPIGLYCRSGGRAGKALQALNEVGYNNVQNVGGIDAARKERGIYTE